MGRKMAVFVSLAMTNAAEGQEDEYNAWYNNQHVPDVLAIPGIKSVRRFRLSDKSRGEVPYQFLAVYEVEVDDITEVQNEIVRRAGTELMPRSPLMQADRLFLDYELIEPVVTAEDAAAMRAKRG